MTPTHLGDLCVYAVRYALGRTSGAPSDVASAVRVAWPAITDDARATLLRDLREAIEDDDTDRRIGRRTGRRLGHDCDRETWTSLLRDLETP
jgi:hypothetical protein